MEKILDIYKRDMDECYPVVCFDERPCQLIEDVLTPSPIKPGNSTASLRIFMRNMGGSVDNLSKSYEATQFTFDILPKLQINIKK